MEPYFLWCKSADFEAWSQPYNAVVEVEQALVSIICHPAIILTQAVDEALAVYCDKPRLGMMLKSSYEPRDFSWGPTAVNIFMFAHPITYK